MSGYLEDADKLPVAHVEENEPLGVGGGEEGGVGVHAHRLVPGQAVLVQVHVDLVHPLPAVADKKERRK